MNTHLWTAAFGLAVSLPRIAVAEQPSCQSLLSRTTVTACALAMSPALREELASQRAAEGRHDAARTILPSNPVLSASVSARASQTERALNWSVGLGQEFEVGGQRGLRIDVADAELRAQAHRLSALKATLVAEAWLGYFRALAARERLQLALRQESASQTVAATVHAMSVNGLSSEVDADISEAAALEASQRRISAEASMRIALARLQTLTGATDVSGELKPLASTASQALRPELLASKEAQAASNARVALLRRTRLPNPTVSLFAQNDGFGERVLGVGLSLPLPLPQPIGRTQAGEIAEAVALAGRTEAEADRLNAQVALERAVAAAEYQASQEILGLYPSGLVQKSEERLRSIAMQVKAGRLPVRDALLVQQALIEQLRAELDAREALCLASVQLHRAAGQPLEGDAL